MNKLLLKLAFISGVVFLSSCGGDSDPGYEFMPNMYRSPSLETYGENTITGMNALQPVEGTVARGHLSTFNYDGTLDGYLAAGNSAVNPFENNEKNLADGKALYGMFCEHCSVSIVMVQLVLVMELLLMQFILQYLIIMMQN